MVSSLIQRRLCIAYKAVELRAQVANLVAQAGSNVQGLTISLEAGAPVCINADALRVDQLLNNLLSNATAYTDAPGIITIGIQTTTDRVLLTVADTPPGLTPQECERLFEPMYRRESARDRNRGGAGLGLAICKNIADAHQARIEAFPSEAGGLSVQIDFPMLRS